MESIEPKVYKCILCESLQYIMIGEPICDNEMREAVTAGRRRCPHVDVGSDDVGDDDSDK